MEKYQYSSLRINPKLKGNSSEISSQRPLVAPARSSVCTVAAASWMPTSNQSAAASPTTAANAVRSTSAGTTARTEAPARPPLEVRWWHCTFAHTSTDLKTLECFYVSYILNTSFFYSNDNDHDCISLHQQALRRVAASPASLGPTVTCAPATITAKTTATAQSVLGTSPRATAPLTSWVTSASTVSVSWRAFQWGRGIRGHQRDCWESRDNKEKC